jgi:hypothetical protein
MISAELAALYPNLAGDGGKKTSEKDPGYNCIAWAAKRDTKWWWQPGGGTGIFWPNGVIDDSTFECFVQLFESLGYVKCDGHELEPFYEKVAIYAYPDGEFSHVAGQLPSGFWTSKLGPDEDIQHNSPHGLEGQNYGEVKQVLKRARCANII